MLNPVLANPVSEVVHCRVSRRRLLQATAGVGSPQRFRCRLKP